MGTLTTNRGCAACRIASQEAAMDSCVSAMGSATALCRTSAATVLMSSVSAFSSCKGANSIASTCSLSSCLAISIFSLKLKALSMRCASSRNVISVNAMVFNIRTPFLWENKNPRSQLASGTIFVDRGTTLLAARGAAALCQGSKKPPAMVTGRPGFLSIGDPAPERDCAFSLGLTCTNRQLSIRWEEAHNSFAAFRL